MDEEVLARAAMASASSVELLKEMLLPFDENRGSSFLDSEFFRTRLANLMKQEDEDDDLTTALLSTMWQDEMVTQLILQEEESKDKQAEQLATTGISHGNATGNGSRNCSDNGNGSINVRPLQVVVPPPPGNHYDEEFGLRLNLDSRQHYNVGTLNPYHHQEQYSSEFFQQPHHHFNVQDVTDRRLVDIEQQPFENREGGDDGELGDDELSEHAFMNRFSHGHHFTRGPQHWDNHDLQVPQDHE